jgi:hypothetical protein
MSKYRRIATDALVVDERYQRPLEEHRVAKIAKSFDETLFGVLEVSSRNGNRQHHVFDGQHRLAAARKLKLTDVPCLVHERLKPEQEAEMFVRLQRERKNINPQDRFRARLFYRDPVALDIVKIAAATGFEIKTNAADAKPDAWRIRAVSALDRIYSLRGPEGLRETLSMVANLWGGDQKAADGGLLDGMAVFLNAYKGRLRDDHLEKLRETSPVTILRRATGGMRGGSVGPLVANELKKSAGMRGPFPRS